MGSNPTALDLFAGAGGWSIACARLGIDDIGIELDPYACKTRRVSGLTTIQDDVSAISPRDFRGVDGLIASPPCQPFSNAGHKRGLGDPRGQLVYQPMRFVRVLLPAWIAMEEVPGVLPIWESFAVQLGRLGYATWTGVLSAEEFGVPQTRRRAILLASLLTHTVGPPAPTHARYRRGQHPGHLLPPRPRWTSMADAIGRGLQDRPAYTVTTRGNGWGGSGARGPIRDAKRTGRWKGPHDALTVAEFGALQDFSVDHPWQGSTENQLKQIGNAVPPGLAFAVLSSVARGAALRRTG